MKTLQWKTDHLEILDQTLLPNAEVWKQCRTYEDVAEAICTLRVRGAPLIGVSAAYGMALAANTALASAFSESEYIAMLEKARDTLAATRPTAVNLFWALDRVLSNIKQTLSAGGMEAATKAALRLAIEMEREDERVNRLIGANGATCIKDGDAILTHCNAGALATAGYGTALGVIRAAVGEGKKVSVFADETRPLLQGARLTAYELMKENIPVTVLCDSMAAVLMRDGKVNIVITGADRIAANGDSANKIGTYGLSVLAKAHGIPFYIAAPLSTVDINIESGQNIPIEYRAQDEVRHFYGVVTAPDVPCFNPALDVTPADNISGIITEAGVLRPPYGDSIYKATNSIKL